MSNGVAIAVALKARHVRCVQRLNGSLLISPLEREYAVLTLLTLLSRVLPLDDGFGKTLGISGELSIGSSENNVLRYERVEILRIPSKRRASQNQSFTEHAGF